MLSRWIVLAVLFGASTASVASAQAAGARADSSAAPIHACALLIPSEVKKLAALPDPLNLYATMPAQEEPLGKGSSCTYPNLHLQIDPFDWPTIEGLLVKNPTQFEVVPDVGDAAYLRANKPARSLEFAELYARVGSHVLTIQMDVPDGKTTASVKPGLVALAKAYAAKLR
jgi:hypothetical protein